MNEKAPWRGVVQVTACKTEGSGCSRSGLGAALRGSVL